MKFITGEPIPQPERSFTVMGRNYTLASDPGYSSATSKPRLLGVELDGYQDGLMLAARIGAVADQCFRDEGYEHHAGFAPYAHGEDTPLHRGRDAIQLQTQLINVLGQREPNEPFGLVALTVRMGEILRSASYVSDEHIQSIGGYMLRDSVHDTWVAHARNEFSQVIPNRG